MIQNEHNTKDIIIKTLVISNSTYYNYLASFQQGINKKDDLTPANYYREVKRGFCTKEKLASQFNITRKTLNQYEVKKWNALERITRGRYVSRHESVEMIAGVLHLGRGVTEAKEYINDLPSLTYIVSALDVAIDVLKDFAEFEPSATKKVRQLNQAKEMIESCIDKKRIPTNPSFDWWEL